MKKIVLILLTAMLIVPTVVVAGQNIEGIYQCSGTNPGGGTYQGKVSILQNGQSYQITWTLGSQIYMGVGIINGDSLSVGYTDAGKTWFGVVVYKINDNRLEGQWTMSGGKTLGTETLTKTK